MPSVSLLFNWSGLFECRWSLAKVGDSNAMMQGGSRSRPVPVQEHNCLEEPQVVEFRHLQFRRWRSENNREIFDESEQQIRRPRSYLQQGRTSFDDDAAFRTLFWDIPEDDVRRSRHVVTWKQFLKWFSWNFCAENNFCVELLSKKGSMRQCCLMLRTFKVFCNRKSILLQFFLLAVLKVVSSKIKDS